MEREGEKGEGGRKGRGREKRGRERREGGRERRGREKREGGREWRGREKREREGEKGEGGCNYIAWSIILIHLELHANLSCTKELHGNSVVLYTFETKTNAMMKVVPINSPPVKTAV